MQITQYLHTAILVAHLEQAEYFYGTVLGLKKVDRILKYPGAWYQVGAVQVHLIEDLTFLPSLQNPEKMGRNPHLALGVENLETAQNHLTAHGCTVEMSASGRAALFTHDPDGNVIELTEVGH
ncbi:MAG: glyoxalase [Leptolyngbyaceae cyanobacterium CSU_1_4]|nr:glyoxalase [Leptolyngbyaceae cyanobacterium CSU_1_4]